MNDRRLMVASEQLAALNAQQHITSDRAERIEYALAEADALIAAAGGQDGGADPGHWHRVAMRQVDEIDGLNAKCADLERNIARLRAENSALEASRHLHATNGETLYARAERAEREVADLQAKLDEAARLARETAGEAMAVALADTPVIVIPEADWKRMVELSIDSQVGHRPAIGAEIKAIIEKVEAANG